MIRGYIYLVRPVNSPVNYYVCSSRKVAELYRLHLVHRFGEEFEVVRESLYTEFMF